MIATEALGPESYLESCTAQALRLVTDLNRRGIHATVKMDDLHLHLHIPVYDKKPAHSQSVRTDCALEQCQEFLQPLHDALNWATAAEAREKKLMVFLDTVPAELLREMADEPEIVTLLQMAVLRRITSNVPL